MQRQADEKRRAEREFGLTFAVVFLIVAGWPLLDGRAPRLWALAVAAGLTTASFVLPSLLATPSRLWRAVGDRLHKVTSPVILLLMFYVVLTPFALIARVFRRDPLGLARDPGRPTYWADRSGGPLDPESFRRQF